MKEKQECQAGLMTTAIALPLCAGLIFGGYQCSPKKVVKANAIKEQTRVERTADEVTPAINEDVENTNNERAM